MIVQSAGATDHPAERLYSHLRTSGLCLFRPTKRPKKYPHSTDQKQHQPSEAAKLCLVNDRSIVNKIEALNELIIDAQPDILPFTETWLTPTNRDNNLVLSTIFLSRSPASRIQKGRESSNYFQIDYQCSLLFSLYF